jgi:hypothetical protein
MRLTYFNALSVHMEEQTMDGTLIKARGEQSLTVVAITVQCCFEALKCPPVAKIHRVFQVFDELASSCRCPRGPLDESIN